MVDGVTHAHMWAVRAEASVQILHYDDVYWIALSGGSSPKPVWGLYAAGNTRVSLPLSPGDADNGTIAVFVPDTVPGANVTGGYSMDTTLTLFGASRANVTMSGGWWELNSVNVRESRTLINGTMTERMLYNGAVSGNLTTTVPIAVGETVVFTKVTPS